ERPSGSSTLAEPLILPPGLPHADRRIGEGGTTGGGATGLGGAEESAPGAWQFVCLQHSLV
ncbi:unnamed protein product, partial [Closterium sp. NIES-54]